MNWNAKIGANNISGNATTITDAQGNYSFSNLPYGYTYINISGASGYRNANISKFTSVAGGTTYSNVNFNLRPSPVGNLTYAGTLKTAGGAGAPIANRTIYLNSMGGSAGTSTQTDANGEFSFTGLAEGNYYVNVDVWSDSLYQNLPWSSSNFLLTSNTSSTDLRLASRSVGSSTVTGFVGAYEAVNGESSATGLAGKQIYVSPQGGGQGFSATTGSDGSWSVTGLVAGEKYWVYTSNINYQEFEYPRDTNSFTVPQSGTYNHRMLFKKLSAGTGSLSGRVKNATNYANIQGITVSLYRSLGGVNIPSVVTNAKGEYSFGNLPEGEYYLSLYDSSSQYQVAYNAAGNSTPAGAKYKSAFMTVEIGSSANRVNAMLTPTNTFAGKLSGVIKDERGVLMANASVQVWDPNDSTIGGYASTNSSGEYSITGIPFGRSMNFKVAPPYDLRFEVTSFSDVVSLSEFVPADTKDVQLAVAGLVSGSVAGIPSTGNVPLVWAQLINPSTGVVVASDYVNQSTGVYTIKSVAQGSYYLQFTQMGKDDGYTGGGGGASGGDVGDPVSLKPVYWNGSPTGTINKSGASTISVGVGGRIEKSITMTKGSSLTGELTVATPTGVSKLTGTRWVQATIYQKQSNGEFAIVGYPQGISGYTNSRLEVAGLAAGTYKLKFEDTRKGTNSLAAVWNGGAATLAAAPAITVGSESTVVVDQSMAMAAPEKTADAFNLDDLEAARLAELENQISTSGTLVPGASTKVFVGTEFAGEYVSAVANSTPVALGTWQQVDKDGYILVTIPSELSGNHRIAVQDVNQQVIGWTPVTIADTNTDPWAVPSSRRSSGTVSDTSATPSASAPSVASAQLGETVKTEMQGPIAPGIWWIAAGIIVLLLIAAGLGIWLFVTRRRP